MTPNNHDMKPREKWKQMLAGKGICPMVSPICDDWSMDTPYYWPYDGADPFPPGHRRHMVSQQMAMAKLCGWDALFITAFDFIPVDESIRPQAKNYRVNGRAVTETRIATPYGDLTNIVERNETSSHIAKEWLDGKEDYKKAIWLAGLMKQYDEETTIWQGKELAGPIGDKGLLGTWVEVPVVLLQNEHEMFYHSTDWPELFRELHTLTVELTLKRLETLRKAGLDYVFYAVWGTEWSSPGFFRDWIMEPSAALINKWRGLGGFTVWHTCGHAAKFIEEGYYNQLMPDVFETLPEPPEGNVPSLKWAREKLDQRIVTKGNVRLDVLRQGSEDDVRASVCRVRQQTEGTRHIVGLCDDMPHRTPLRNARAFVEEALR